MVGTSPPQTQHKRGPPLSVRQPGSTDLQRRSEVLHLLHQPIDGVLQLHDGLCLRVRLRLHTPALGLARRAARLPRAARRAGPERRGRLPGPRRPLHVLRRAEHPGAVPLALLELQTQAGVVRPGVRLRGVRGVRPLPRHLRVGRQQVMDGRARERRRWARHPRHRGHGGGRGPGSGRGGRGGLAGAARGAGLVRHDRRLLGHEAAEEIQVAGGGAGHPAGLEGVLALQDLQREGHVLRRALPGPWPGLGARPRGRGGLAEEGGAAAFEVVAEVQLVGLGDNVVGGPGGALVAEQPVHDRLQDFAGGGDPLEFLQRAKASNCSDLVGGDRRPTVHIVYLYVTPRTLLFVATASICRV